MKISFNGQTIIVTGATRGIGKQIADDLLASGANLILTGTDQKQIDAVWRHNFKTTRFFKLYQQHRFERQQKKILLEKKREELFDIQKNFDKLNKKYIELEANY